MMPTTAARAYVGGSEGGAWEEAGAARGRKRGRRVGGSEGRAGIRVEWGLWVDAVEGGLGGSDAPCPGSAALNVGIRAEVRWRNVAAAEPLIQAHAIRCLGEATRERVASLLGRSDAGWQLRRRARRAGSRRLFERGASKLAWSE